MGQLFKAWLIDPVARSVAAVHTDGTLESLCRLLQCSTLDAVDFDERHVLWVDDEGLLVDHDEQRFFVLNGPDRLHLIGGRALVAAPEGDAKASEAQLRARVAFPHDQRAAKALAKAMCADLCLIASKEEHAAAIARRRLRQAQIRLLLARD